MIMTNPTSHTGVTSIVPGFMIVGIVPTIIVTSIVVTALAMSRMIMLVTSKHASMATIAIEMTSIAVIQKK